MFTIHMHCTYMLLLYVCVLSSLQKRSLITVLEYGMEWWNEKWNEVQLQLTHVTSMPATTIIQPLQ